MNMNIFRKRKKMSAKQIREKYGRLSYTNATSVEINNGIDRQWRRYNDPEFQEKEFEEKFKRVFGMERA